MKALPRGRRLGVDVGKVRVGVALREPVCLAQGSKSWSRSVPHSFVQDGTPMSAPSISRLHLRRSDAPAAAVQLRDAVSGEEFRFDAEVVINASGPWTDLTNAALGAASSYMGGTKGSHIVLDHPELLAACNGREIFFEHTDGRIVLIYPMGDRVLQCDTRRWVAGSSYRVGAKCFPHYNKHLPL